MIARRQRFSTRNLLACWASTVLCLGLFAAPALAKSFDCARRHCALLTRGNNPDLVVGTVEATATPAQMRAVYRWSRRHGYWTSLPANARKRLNFIRLVSVSVPSARGSRSVTVLMTRQEYDSGPLKPGALVRYTPHDGPHRAITFKDRAKEAYWLLVGCVAQLCAPGDTACAGHYRQGLFARRSGRQLQLGNLRLKPNGTMIDPGTLLPVSDRQ